MKAILVLTRALLVTTTLVAQGEVGPTSSPSTTTTATSASALTPRDTAALLVGGWLEEILDRDPARARASYEAAIGREEPTRDFHRLLAFSRIAEIDVFLARPERVTEVRQRMREIGQERNAFPPLPLGSSSVRRTLEALTRVLREPGTESAPTERIVELRRRLQSDVQESGVLARPFVSRQLGASRPPGRQPVQTQIDSLRASLEDARRRGDQVAMTQLQAQIDVHAAELLRFQPRRESLRAYALEIVRQRLEGKDERAMRLEEAVKQAEFGGVARRMLRGLNEAEPRGFAQRMFSNLEGYLKSEHELTQDERTTLVACRDRAKLFLAEGNYAKARDLLWPLLLVITRF